MPLFAEVPVTFPLASGVLLASLPLGAYGTVFGAVGSGKDRLAADAAAFFRPLPHDLSVQLPVCREDRLTEPSAQQRIGKALHTGTRFPIIQGNTVAVVEVAAQRPYELFAAPELLIADVCQISHFRIPAYSLHAGRHPPGQRRHHRSCRSFQTSSLSAALGRISAARLPGLL